MVHGLETLKRLNEEAVANHPGPFVGNKETLTWIDASLQLPDAGNEVLVCFERNDCEDRDTCIAEFDDSLDGESPWYVDGGLTHFGIVLFWAEKPVGPQR